MDGWVDKIWVTLTLWSNYMFTFFKQKWQSEKYLVQSSSPSSAKNPVLFLSISHIYFTILFSIFLSCWHKVQPFIDTQQDFSVVCMLILFIDFHCPFLQKERVEKPQILNIYISDTGLCVFFKEFYIWRFVRWVGGLNNTSTIPNHFVYISFFSLISSFVEKNMNMDGTPYILNHRKPPIWEVSFSQIIGI